MAASVVESTDIAAGIAHNDHAIGANLMRYIASSFGEFAGGYYKKPFAVKDVLEIPLKNFRARVERLFKGVAWTPPRQQIVDHLCHLNGLLPRPVAFVEANGLSIQWQAYTYACGYLHLPFAAYYCMQGWFPDFGRGLMASDDTFPALVEPVVNCHHRRTVTVAGAVSDLHRLPNYLLNAAP